MSWSQVRRRLAAAAALGAGVAVLCSWGLVADRLDGVQRRWEDRLQPGLASSDDVAVIAIDRETLSAAGISWPWPRDVHAELLRTIAAGEPAVVGYDVLFAESRDGDDALIAAMGEVPTVLPSALTLTASPGEPPEIVDAVLPADQLAAAASAVGHANITVAGDSGVVRELPLYAVDDRGFVYPSLVLAAVAAADGASGPVTERPGGVQVGDRFVPLDDGELAINWAETLSPEDVIPAIDVLDGSFDVAQLAGRVVLVGVTDSTLGDQHLVPVDHSGGTSGVVVLANATNTVLSSGYLRQPPMWAQLVLIIAAAILVTSMFAATRLAPALISALVVVAAVVLFATWRFHADGVQWNVVWPVIAVLLATATGTVWQEVTESRHRRRAWRLFATYVPAEVVRQLEDPHRLAAAVSGTRCDVTVVFCDLRGFTAMSGGLTPPRVRELLETYYDYVVAIIRRERGTVMQFVGDEVFAVFGAPVPDADDASAAVRCALALQDEIGSLHRRLGAAGLPSATFGVGVHRGPVVAAHVGTAQRRQYAVVGETVNLGGRLCEAAGPGEIVVSEQALDEVEGVPRERFAAAEAIELKGVKWPVSVYRARFLSPTRDERGPSAGAIGAGGDGRGDRSDVPVDTTSITSERESRAVGGRSRGSDG
jgi:adenylate cyclase